jgi:hypothetical protein
VITFIPATGPRDPNLDVLLDLDARSAHPARSHRSIALTSAVASPTSVTIR